MMVPAGAVGAYRYRILALLVSASLLTYLDRVCIGIAGPRIQDELHLSTQDWGLVTGAFALAYALLEIPGGVLADRFGARAMMTRIVLWWSAFTALTALARERAGLVVVRFCFGAGEAGSYPTIATGIRRWFPEGERGRAFGFVILAGQLGGAIAPLFLVPIQMRWGWRCGFVLLGAAGVAWAALWWYGYRNSPAEAPAVGVAEREHIGTPTAVVHTLTLRALLTHRSVALVTLATFGFQSAYYFTLFWLPLYLMRARGFSEGETRLAAVPFLIGALGNAAGGLALDGALRRWGERWAPRLLCCGGLALGAACAFAVPLTSDRYLALALLAVCYGALTFQQPANWVVCVKLGGPHCGAVTGAMNSAGALGGLCSALLIGHLVSATGSYDGVLRLMGAVLAFAALLWLGVDARDRLATEPGAVSAAAAR
ncbi:MAG: MFS transporter [Proteobacteria bacterium]|nr:MFS transporter [Pseudomonadota bacterium]